MLRDEAIEILLQRVEGSLDAKLRIAVDHGHFTAQFDTDSYAVRGEPSTVLTNALSSLVEAFDD